MDRFACNFWGKRRGFQIANHRYFHKNSAGVSVMFSRMPRLARPVAPATDALRVASEVGIDRRAVEPGASSALWLRHGERFSMDDEARATGLAPRLTGSPKTGLRSGPKAIPRAGPGGAGDRPTGIRGRTSSGAGPARSHSGGGSGAADLSGPTCAALDLGTNNCRLLVARATRDGFRVIDAFSRIIRLGEGVEHLRPAERSRHRPRRRGASRSAAPRCATAASPVRG